MAADLAASLEHRTQGEQGSRSSSERWPISVAVSS
jgi:hypothetical protein